MDCSYMYACTHRKDYACKNGEFGDLFEVWGNGWLGTTTASDSHRRVFSYAKQHENWQQCAAYLDVIGSQVVVNQFSIYSKGEERWAIVNGTMYKQ